MTIGIGLVCSDGVVVGADREMTLETLKVTDRKAHLIKEEPIKVALGGSGTTDLITFAAQECGRRLQAAKRDVLGFEDVRLLITEMLADIRTDHIDKNPDVGHKLDLMVGIKIANGMPRLLKIAGGIPIWVENHQAIGWGAELATYVLNGRYDEKRKPDVRGGIILATHALKAAKDYARYCAGASDIIFLKPGMKSDFVSSDDILLHEQSADRFAEITKPLMIALTDVGVSPQALDDLIGKMQVELHNFRPNSFIQQQAMKLEQKRQPLSLHGSDTSSGVIAVTTTYGNERLSVYGADQASPSSGGNDDEQ